MALLCVLVTSASAQVFTGMDLGNPTHHGSVVTNADGSLSINGGGNDIWNATSDCYYYYTWASGQNWSAGFKVDKDIVGGDPTWAKCDLMVTASDQTAGPQGSDAFIAFMYTKPSGADWLCDRYRAVANGSADWIYDDPPTLGQVTYHPPVWLNITRLGPVFKLLYSLDGKTWQDYVDINTSTNAFVGDDNQTSFGTAFPDPVAIGIAVTAGNDGDTVGTTATVSDGFLKPIGGPTAFGISQQPANATNYAGCEVSFIVATTNNSMQPTGVPLISGTRTAWPLRAPRATLLPT